MDINGTYLGLSPTDESGVGAGELEVVFTDEVIRYRMATGLEIRSEETSRAELRQLTAEEIAAEFNPDLNPADVAAFTIGDDGPVFLMLLETADYPERVSADAPRVVVFRFVSDEIDAIFGETFLFTPKQVEAGLYEKAVAAIEQEQGDPGVIPRIANNGKRS